MAYPKPVPSGRQSHRKARNSQAQKASVYGTGREAVRCGRTVANLQERPCPRVESRPRQNRRYALRRRRAQVALLARARTDVALLRQTQRRNAGAGMFDRGRVRSAVSATAMLRWSPSLMEVLLEELYVDDGLEGLLGKSRKLNCRYASTQGPSRLRSYCVIAGAPTISHASSKDLA